jgi:cobalt-zinc-cadmium efflux system outer membrane protein
LIFPFSSAAWTGADSPRNTPAPAAADSASAAAVIDVAWPDIVRAVERDPRLAAARFDAAAARAAVAAAGAIPNPVVEGNVGEGVSKTDDASDLEWGIAVTLPLDWIAKRGSVVDAARAGAEVALAQEEALRREALLQLSASFWNLAYEQERVSLLEKLEAQTSWLVHAVRRRVEKGEIRPVEAPRAEVELEKVRNELESARTSLEARRLELGLWIGAPRGAAIRAVTDLEELPEVPDLDTASSLARKNHPALAAGRARTQLLEAEVGAEKMTRVPAFSLTGYASDELDRRAYGVGVVVDVPLWNWNGGRIAEAEARLAAGRRAADAAGIEVEVSVVEIQAACQSSVATAARFKSNVVPRSESAAATMERAYELGEANLLDVIDARRTLLEAQSSYLSALARAHIDRSRLGALIGEEPK